MAQGKLLVISGNPGVGKDTIISIVTSLSNFSRVPSCTTRPPRDEEIDGVHYHFLTNDMFEQRKHALLDDVHINGYRYGPSMTNVKEALDSGKDSVVHLIVESAELVKAELPDATLVYLLAPSSDILVRRMRGRGTPEDEIKKRLQDQKLMAEPTQNYQLTIINEEGEQREVSLQILIKLNI